MSMTVLNRTHVMLFLSIPPDMLLVFLNLFKVGFFKHSMLVSHHVSAPMRE